MEFLGFTLDPFQEESIHELEKNNSVIVSAATGTGKTLIADYLINKFNKLNKHVIYTAPIKALSNQKYKQFKKAFGEEKVGLITGDVVINHDAQILVMTTEIYRNMLLTHDKIIENLSYVIFDEIHYINDIERGTVWEESIIFSPPHVRFLCLSATIPNAQEFADWIRSIKEKDDPDHHLSVVTYSKRAVPLTHFLYDTELGITKSEDLKKSIQLDRHPRMDKRGRITRFHKFKAPFHLDLIDDLQDERDLPAIFFVFSRNATEQKAQQAAKRFDFTTGAQKKKIIHYINENISHELRSLSSVRLIKQTLPNGVGVHHAGLLPSVKAVVEHLFDEGLVKVLYATETFAVGINMPAKTVCFNSIYKFDGINFRYLKSKEYYQMAGRAGRRGIDDHGTVIVMLDRGKDDINKIITVTSQDVEPIISQFKLSTNTVINLIHNHTEEEISKILKSNFDFYQLKTQNKLSNIVASYKAKVRKLTKMGYVSKDGKLTEKGMFLRHIHTEELLVGEIFATDLWKRFSESEINCVIAGIVFEGRKNVKFHNPKKSKKLGRVLNIINRNLYLKKNYSSLNFKKIFFVVDAWSNNIKFKDLTTLSSMQEGDYIRIFRNITDLIRQIMKATSNGDLYDKLSKAKQRIYRDVIEVKF
jgi:superfamily II RNA helicase